MYSHVSWCYFCFCRLFSRLFPRWIDELFCFWGDAETEKVVSTHTGRNEVFTCRACVVLTCFRLTTCYWSLSGLALHATPHAFVTVIVLDAQCEVCKKNPFCSPPGLCDHLMTMYCVIRGRKKKENSFFHYFITLMSGVILPCVSPSCVEGESEVDDESKRTHLLLVLEF